MSTFEFLHALTNLDAFIKTPCQNPLITITMQKTITENEHQKCKTVQSKPFLWHTPFLKKVSLRSYYPSSAVFVQ